MKTYLIFGITFIFFSLCVASQEVGVGVYTLSLGKFDIATGSSTSDFYLDFKCSENCSTINYEFMNGRASSLDIIIDTPQEKFYRIQATLVSPIDLRSFPFDKQKLQIIVEDKKAPLDQLKFYSLTDQSGIDPSVLFTGFQIDGWNSLTRDHEYTIYNETFSQYVYEVNISRIKLNSFLKTFLPIIFIVLIVLCSFVMDPDKITTRLGMAGAALTASVMFHISIANQIPPVGYATFADKFMALTYFILLITFVMNIAMLELIERKNPELVEKIHRRTEFSMFVLVPLLYVVLFAFGV